MTIDFFYGVCYNSLIFIDKFKREFYRSLLTFLYVVGINRAVSTYRDGGTMAYIVCEKRRGNPKINVEVCQRKCEFTEECTAYQKHLAAAAPDPPGDVESYTAAPSHGESASTEAQAV
jgi:hypothetical protein